MTTLSNLKLHYFTIVKGSFTMGRGEYVRLLLEDAAVNFEYVRFNAAQWKEEKERLLKENIRAPTMPYITVDGKYYGKTVPIMRYIAKKLGKYEGETDEENQLLDAYSDMVLDWASKWGAGVFSNDDEVVKTYREEYVPQAHKNWDLILSDTTGPYLLGENISYADFALYHIMEDDNEAKVNAESYPHLAAFVQAFEARPNIAKYFTTERK